MHDIIVIGAGISGAAFAHKVSKFAKTLLLEARDEKNKKESPLTNIFPNHNRIFLKDVDYDNKSLFPCVHYKINYMSHEYNGIVDSMEFGAPFGHISYTEKLITHLIQKSEAKGCTVKFNEKVSKINISNEKIEVISNKGVSYPGKLVAIATGSHGFELQKSLGFQAPDSYKGIYVHLYGDEDHLNELSDFNYLFHINNKISDKGPFFINKGRERISTGFLGKSNETYAEIVSKLNRILDNYKPIQPYIAGLKKGPITPVIGKISKHPLSNFSQNRAIILGEAAGLVTSFFYEGILGGLASAHYASKVIKPLLGKNSVFSRNELNPYDEELRKNLLDTYFKNGAASEYLFYNSGSAMKTIWETYTKFITENKTIRRYVWEAIRSIEGYDVSRDRWLGEQIFKNLPFVSKITLGPTFLRALFK
ncbi:MAG: NAD(P)/FAD-dependent oxidoreductase [Promethearchaeota archaeon]|nr:MAG: NAD(P)/FAD-dependent oxidoreductase [Candidatus Lokiarchaeota archaeon]